jgi:hypothetical protein
MSGFGVTQELRNGYAAGIIEFAWEVQVDS